MKQLIFLLLFPCLAMAQYPGNAGQKITLGEQTSADGLVYRGVENDTALITPSSDTSAYIILDTVNNRFYNYNRATNVWSLTGGGVSVSSFSAGTTGLTPSTATTGAVTLGGTLAVANGGTNTSTLTANKVMVGNGTNGVLTPTNLHWDNTNSALSIGASSPLYKLDVSGTKNNVGVRVSSNNTNDILYYATGTGTGDINLFKSALNYTGKQNFFLQNGNTVSGGSALIIEVDSASTGDAYVNYVSTRATNWSIGLDNSNNDVLTIQPLATPSTSGTLSGLLTFTTNGKIGVLNKTPTALFHLAAGTATTAPIRLTSSGATLLSSLESGAIEFNGTNLLFTPSNTRHTVNHGLTGSATLDFLSTNAQNSRDMTIAVTGAADGDVVSLGVPNAAVNANTSYSAWVSAANTVTVRFNNYSSGTVDPASGTFKVFVTK